VYLKQDANRITEKSAHGELQLRDLEFGVILCAEQIDVRRFLLADSSKLQSGAPRLILFSNLDFRVPFKEDFPWLH
jgi:hypothetical protein